MSDFLKNQINDIKANHRYRFLRTIESDQSPEVQFEGKSYINFSSNNYLGLANHPALKQASMEAIEKYGTSSGASRLITGSMRLHADLEETIARFKGCEKALVFNSGYQANIGLISSLTGPGDAIFSDALNHASLIDGCRLSKADTYVYAHNDLDELKDLLKTKSGNQKLIVTDTVFSMDGDLASLSEIVKLAEDYDAWVLVDEAHATGVFGDKGRGVVEHCGIDSTHPRLIQMGTLGKALGSFGAYVCGSHDLIDFLINRARSLIYTTSLPPAVLAASQKAFELISQDSSFKKDLWAHVAFFKQELTTLLKNTPYHLGETSSPIFPVIIGDDKRTMELSEQLFNQGLWVQGIRPPTVAAGTARLRLTLMANHSRAHLEKCLEILKENF